MNTMVSPPGTNGQYATKLLGGMYLFKVDSLVSIISLCRVYHFIRLYVHYSKWLSGETHQICKRFGFVPDISFVIKTELK